MTRVLRPPDGECKWTPIGMRRAVTENSEARRDQRTMHAEGADAQTASNGSVATKAP